MGFNKAEFKKRIAVKALRESARHQARLAPKSGNPVKMSEMDQRVARIKARLAEARESGVKIDPKHVAIRESISAIRAQVASLSIKMKEGAMMMPPAEDPDMDMDMDMNADPALDPEMAGTDVEMETDLPESIVAEIQNLKTSIDSLASIAGIVPDVDLGADVDASIPAVEGQGDDGEVDPSENEPTSNLFEGNSAKSKKDKIAEAIKRRREGQNSSDATIKNLQKKIAERRAAIKDLRESYESEGISKITQQVAAEVDEDPRQHVNQKNQQQTAGRKIGGDSPSMPGNKKLDMAKTWTPSKLKQGATIDGAFGKVKEETLMDKHINRYVESKQLSFADLMKNGLLG
jgi:hypothetical protein